MVDKEIVQNRLLKLEEYIKDLEEYQNIKSTKYKEDKLLKRFLERTLHLAIEACLDIGNHIISDERLGLVDNNADVIRVLAENDIIKAKEENYIKMAKFRNIIVHDYATLDDEIMIKVLKENLNDLKQFLIWIKEYIS